MTDYKQINYIAFYDEQKGGSTTSIKDTAAQITDACAAGGDRRSGWVTALKNANPAVRSSIYFEPWHIFVAKAGQSPYSNTPFELPSDLAYIQKYRKEALLLDSNGKVFIPNPQYNALDFGVQWVKDELIRRIEVNFNTLAGSPLQWAWDSVFFDDFPDLHLLGSTSQRYGKVNSPAWENGAMEALEDVQRRLFIPNAIPLIINVVIASDTTYYRILNALNHIAGSGVMVEDFASGWKREYLSRSAWLNKIERTKTALSMGLVTWNVGRFDSLSAWQFEQGAGGKQSDYEQAVFCLASYLLVKSIHSRYRGGSDYANFTRLKAYADVDALGVPLGDYSVSGDSFSRSFEGGEVKVNPVTRTYSITYTTKSSSRYAPEVTPIANQSAIVGDEFKYQVIACSYNGGQLRFSATGLPDGVTINPRTGLFNGVVGIVGLYSVVVIVHEGALSVSSAFKLEVKNA